MSKFKRFSLAIALAAGAATVSVCAAPITGQGTWESTLRARDINGNAVDLSSAYAAFFYDTTLNITWVANMNMNFVDLSNRGMLSWDAATAWANSLNLGGFDDWRLPAVIDSGAPGCQWSYQGGTDCGYNVQTQVRGAYSEWAHLYYVTLGNLALCPAGGPIRYTCDGPQLGWGLTNTAYFRGLEANAFQAWSGTEFEVAGSGSAWWFVLYNGSQYGYGRSIEAMAVAVRSGDVLAGGTVPEPQSLALVLMALVGMGVSLRRNGAT